MSVIKPCMNGCKWIGYTDTKTGNKPLDLITIQVGCSVFSLNLKIPAVNSFTSKVSIPIWG